MNFDKETQRSFKVFGLWIFGVWLLTPVLVIIATATFNYLLTKYFSHTTAYSAQLLLGPGIFGDMFGAVNALFTGLAFLAVFATLIIQFKEIKSQADAQEASKEMQAKQTDAIVNQLKTMQDNLEFDKTRARMMAEPVFIMTGGSIGDYKKSLVVRNIGMLVTNLSVKSDANHTINIDPSDALNESIKADIQINCLGTDVIMEIPFSIFYTNSLGESLEQKYVYSHQANKLKRIY